MTFDARRLYELLPAEHRTRDASLGYPLRELIGIIAGQVAVTEDNLEQLYENSFVETAAPWALPYLGDLLGIRGLSGAAALTRAPRAEVGHTIAYRRRKGTAAMLELLAHDATGWPARAVEYFDRLATTQNVNHVRLGNQAMLSMRSPGTPLPAIPPMALEDFGTAFEPGTRTVEVRRIEPGLGKWNIPSVGVFVWRLHPYVLTRTPLASSATLPDGRHFTFHPLGLDIPLFTLPATEDEVTHLAEPQNVPMPISRRRLCGQPYAPGQFHPSTAYYGRSASFVITRETAAAAVDLDASELLVSDLSDVRNLGVVTAWAHEAYGLAENRTLVDPMLGRVVFPKPPAKRVFATFHYGFSMNIGGGEYNRRRSRAVVSQGATQRVSNTVAAAFATIPAALAALPDAGGMVEILDSGRYVEALPAIDAARVVAGAPPRQIELRAADQRRPLVLLGAPLSITGDADGIVTLDGLLLSGAAIAVTGNLGRLRLRHCTIVPQLTVGPDGTAALTATPALTVTSMNTAVEIEGCVMGPIRVGPDVTVHVTNSIIDAGAPTAVAIADAAGTKPMGTWRIERSTIRGKVGVTIMQLASNSIFAGARADGDAWSSALLVTRRQEGCVRFCWLPAGALVPRRHACLPADGEPDIRPAFTSFAFNDPAYAQLDARCPDAIQHGADDESELGAFHDLFQPQYLAHLRVRLAEYLRFGLEAGVFPAT